MKHRTVLLAAVCLLCLLALVACTPSSGGTTTAPVTTPSDGGITITAATGTVIRTRELAGYDYTRLFTVTEDGRPVPVEKEWVDASTVGTAPGTYYVTCATGGKQAIAIVEIRESVYELTLSVPSVSLKQAELDSFDPLSLFSATVDGEPLALTADMAVTDLASDPGRYSYSVTVGDKTVSLAIEVRADYLLEVIPACRTLELTPDEIADYDFTALFSLFADGIPVRVTADMVDASALASAEVGKDYRVQFSYRVENTVCRTSVTVMVREKAAVTVTAKNVVTYPGSPAVDLLSLFEVRQGDTLLAVTSDMITGSVDYTGIGVYEITLHYPGCAPAVATVEIRAGVVISAPGTVIVRRGTDPALYDFAADFTVIVNGVRFTDFPASALDISGVSFDAAGEGGSAVLTIRYNKDPLTGLSGKANYVDYTATIRYIVTENTYTADVKKEEVLLPAGTAAYDIYDNLTVTVNGRRQTLTENPDYADAISCYVRRLSNPVDFNSVATQRVRVAVYVNGPQNDPIELSYDLRIDSGVVVSSAGAWVFAGSPLSLCDLFSVTDGDTQVDVTYEMLSGRVDIFTPGTYTVTLNYRGIVSTATVTVFDAGIPGTYRTGLTTLGSDEEEDEEGYVTGGTARKPLPDLVIAPDGTVTAGKEVYRIVGGTDGTTLQLLKGGNRFTLHYEDGIAVIDPDNSIKLTFGDSRRPLVYFHEDKWTVEAKVTVNYSAAYVLESTNPSYSIDTFRLTAKDGTRSLWYGLKVRLASRTSADTVYVVSWGEAVYPDGFVPAEGTVSSLTFGEETVFFTMASDTTAKVNRESSARLWAGRLFTGTVDGKEAVLSTDQYENYTFRVGGEKIFTVSYANDLSSMKNGGADYAAGRLFVYSEGNYETTPYSYLFSVDAEAGTFEVMPRDALFGVYTLGDITLFLDGYGTGHISFDPKSYQRTLLSYTESNSLLTVRYRDILPGYAYGDGASFFVSPLLNLLTVREMPGTALAGQIMTNTHITDGAIVEISSAQVGAGSSAEKELLSAIRIITPAGELEGTEKSSAVNFRAVKFGAEGFYQFTVTVPVGGEQVTCYYAVQVLPSVCAGKPVAASWGQGTLNTGYGLTLDGWGRVTLTSGDRVYTGLATVSDDGSSFVARVRSADGSLMLAGTVVSDGLLRLSVSGGANLTEYYTTGSFRVIGCAGTVLRAYTVGGRTLFFLAASAAGEGTPVQVACDGDIFAAGSVLTVTAGETSLVVRVNSWGNTTGGLTVSDAWRGSYETSDGKQLVLDGFGNATFDGAEGTYRISGGLVVTVTDKLRAFRPDTKEGTCTEVAVVLNADSFSGKCYTADYNFICGNYSYTATTTFRFYGGGSVEITSVSPSHDDPENGCEGDLYQPVFVTAGGTYTVEGDVLTVRAGGYVFTFLVTDVVGLSRLECNSTTLPTGAQGYFRIGTVFAL